MKNTIHRNDIFVPISANSSGPSKLQEKTGQEYAKRVAKGTLKGGAVVTMAGGLLGLATGAIVAPGDLAELKSLKEDMSPQQRAALSKRSTWRALTTAVKNPELAIMKPPVLASNIVSILIAVTSVGVAGAKYGSLLGGVIGSILGHCSAKDHQKETAENHTGPFAA